MPEPELEAEVLDIQHDTDPAQDHGPARRIPHLGHALLFFSLAWMSMNLCAIILYSSAHINTSEAARQHPGIGALALAAGYFLALAMSFQLFPRIWHRSFLHGIQWNVLAAHRRWLWIVPSAIVLSALAQYADLHLKAPDDDSLLKIMSTPLGAWLVTAFGVLLAPLTEEIAFRGFLLPALATAYDWLALDRSPAGIRKWEMSSGHTITAVIFGAVFSSIPFALIHAPQLQHAWGPVGVIFAVSLAFSYVRIRCHSVACSVLMHAVYNLSTFASVFYATGGYRHLDKIAQ